MMQRHFPQAVDHLRGPGSVQAVRGGRAQQRTDFLVLGSAVSFGPAHKYASSLQRHGPLALVWHRP